MKRFFLAALICVLMTANFSICGAAGMHLSDRTAKEIYSEMKRETDSDVFWAKVKNFRKDSRHGKSGPIIKSWMFDCVMKSGKKSRVEISLGVGDDDRPYAASAMKPAESTKSNPDLKYLLCVSSFLLLSAFDLPEKECYRIVDDFAVNPRVDEWTSWDSAHKKLVHAIFLRREGHIGFLFYATDGENESGGVANGEFTGAHAFAAERATVH